MSKSIYKKIILSKTNSKLPATESGRTFESKYNPEREAESLIQGFAKSTGFFLIIGISSGILIEKIRRAFPKAAILAFEHSREDLDFLMRLDTVKKLSRSEKVIFCDITDLRQNLVQSYIPALCGRLEIFENKAWTAENQEKIPQIKSEIEDALGEISADFSVQAHFGKIWQKNILCNLKIFSRTEKMPFCGLSHEDLQKTAAVIAAGPSLDRKISELRKGDFYIIATDTAFEALLKYGIIADMAVSIDGQSVSYNHFMNCKSQSLKKTRFFFDLCANPWAAKKLLAKNASLSYFCSGHPLCEFAQKSQGLEFLKLFSGRGTVTIAAADLALKAGFKRLRVFGADFGYSGGKPYAKGSYLDTLCNLSASRLFTGEQAFTRLMYRTELKAQNQLMVSPVLEAYRQSFEKYLTSQGCKFGRKDDVYEVTREEGARITGGMEITRKENPPFDFDKFIKSLCTGNEKEYFYLLPYIAWLRKNPKHSENTIEEFISLARNNLGRYN